ncbi:hypothetical protein FCIRC_7766 [Fusarium circinatum]|uniref:Uncharacterized protein n=1 Tax=Fusarium circinatum TaxID=48490 RepID=A0A8H5WY31_FUSCI|nr:hypothetical protein FCIRC_7766 [Fusarium circinatum]
MDLSWLQNLNLLLTRTSGALHQNNTWKRTMVEEVKHTLLCLARRREHSGGRLVVTSEHLTKAVQYFDVRLVVADMDFDEKNDTDKPRINFFQRYYDHYQTDEESEESEESDASEDLRTSSGYQSKSSASTSNKTQTDSQKAAPSTNATTPAKGNA